MQTTQRMSNLEPLANKIMLVAADEEIEIFEFKDEIQVDEDGDVMGVVKLKYRIPSSLVTFADSEEEAMAMIGCACRENCNCFNEEEN